MRIRVPLQIRWKVLLSMLVIGISPLLISAWLDVRSLSELGTLLAQQSGQALSEQTRGSLEQMADNYARLVDRERQLIELLVRIQATDAQKLLSGEVPADGEVHWSEAFDRGKEALELLIVPDKYRQPNGAGVSVPAPVSFKHQAFYAPAPVDRIELLPDALRLSQLTVFYTETRRNHSNIVHRQYVALNSGLIGVFPGHGGHPADFDPRERSWYAEQNAAKDFRWSSPHIDVTSRLAMINATMPIMNTGGSLAGVAGIDVRLTSLLHSLELPPHLGTESDVLVTFLGEGTEPEILIVAETAGRDAGDNWRALPSVKRLVLGTDRAQRTIRDRMRTGRGGYLRTTYAERDVFCVYRPFGDNRGYLVFLVPAAAVVDPAVKAAEYALASTKRQVATVMPLAIGILVVVAVVSLISSKTITEPINRLVEAASRVGNGDFDVRVDIDTGDELERLGDVFNNMVPELEEHTRVREALSLASEVQRHLLPEDCPEIDGIDISGFSIYCDQTGGDYYDFLDLSGSDSSKVGVALGDVSGHGIASALLMTTVRALLHGIADDARAPAEILQHINQKLADDVHAGQFMTLFFLNIDVDTRQVHWASAGHDAAIRYSPATDSFSMLEGNDIPLGVDRNWRYTVSNTEVLGRNDIVLLGTDGIWETRNEAGEFFGKERLRDLITEKQYDSAQSICDRIVRALRNFRGASPQTDDVTAVVFRLGA